MTTKPSKRLPAEVDTWTALSIIRGMASGEGLFAMPPRCSPYDVLAEIRRVAEQALAGAKPEAAR